MVADPFHLLDCSMTRPRAAARSCSPAPTSRRDLAQDPVCVLGGNGDTSARRTSTRRRGTSAATVRADWSTAPSAGGRRRTAWSALSGLGPDDVDVCELYDPFSFEIIRQFEAFGFCGEGEGGDFVMGGAIEPGGQHPVTTDGGVMSFSHGGAIVQMLQRVIRGVQQLRGECADHAGRGRRGRAVLERRRRARCSPT